jgi:hypothetical protein
MLSAVRRALRQPSKTTLSTTAATTTTTRTSTRASPLLACGKSLTRPVSTTTSTTAASWDATHQRVTFYCPLELLETIEADMHRSGRKQERGDHRRPPRAPDLALT